MPTYEYRCRTCNHGFEIQQSISEDALTECPECAGELRKVFHPVGIAFKGEGFYKNDARADSGGGSASSSNGNASGTAGKDDKSGSSVGDGGTGSSTSTSDSGGTGSDRTKSDKTGSGTPGATKATTSGSTD